MDVSHSRPRKVRTKAPVRAFDVFLQMIDRVIRGNPFIGREGSLPLPTVSAGDARDLDYEDSCFDLVITSPPYLNAIDYLRGHKLSLVWMRKSIELIRGLRASNIGAEVKATDDTRWHIHQAMESMGSIDQLGNREKGFLQRYAGDMDCVCREIGRVLREDGRAIMVMGDSTLKGVFLSNSSLVKTLAEHHGLEAEDIEVRPLSDKHRYLPPPGNCGSDTRLKGRMRNEVVLTLRKTG